jgi:hypothetical protein
VILTTPLTRRDPRHSALTQSKDDIVDRCPSEKPIPVPQIDNQMLVIIFQLAQQSEPIHKRKADQEEDRGLDH